MLVVYSVVTDSEFASESVNFSPVRPSPNPRIVGGRKWRFWNVCSKKFFTSFLKFIPPKPHQIEWHWRHFYLPIDILQQQHSSACCLREVLIYTFAAVWCTDTKPHVCKHVYNTFIQNPKPSPDPRIFFINPSESIRLQDFEILNNTSSVPPLWSIKCCVSALC